MNKLRLTFIKDTNRHLKSGQSNQLIKHIMGFKQSGQVSDLVPIRKEVSTPAEFRKLAAHKSPARAYE